MNLIIHTNINIFAQTRQLDTEKIVKKSFPTSQTQKKSRLKRAYINPVDRLFETIFFPYKTIWYSTSGKKHKTILTTASHSQPKIKGALFVM